MENGRACSSKRFEGYEITTQSLPSISLIEIRIAVPIGVGLCRPFGGYESNPFGKCCA